MINIVKKISSITLLFLFISSIAFAKTYPSTYAIDSPTAVIFVPKEYSLNYTIYNEGGVTTSFEFGIVKNFNVGLALDFYKLISDDNMETRNPRLKAKYRIFDGNFKYPEIAIGYDGQSYGEYDKDEHEYLQKEKGLYLVLGKEIFTPDLIFSGGINMDDFEDIKLYGFLSLGYLVRDRFMAFLEYDNIHNAPENRLNIGFRYLINESLSMGISMKKINDSDDGCARILQITYIGDFL